MKVLITQLEPQYLPKKKWGHASDVINKYWPERSQTTNSESDTTQWEKQTTVMTSPFPKRFYPTEHTHWVRLAASKQETHFFIGRGKLLCKHRLCGRKADWEDCFFPFSGVWSLLRWTCSRSSPTALKPQSSRLQLSAPLGWSISSKKGLIYNPHWL